MIGKSTGLLSFLPLLLFANACDTSHTPTVPEVVSDTRQDIGHGHRHIHGSGQVHEHEHTDGFVGAHAHVHQHPHRHPDPIHGGRIIDLLPAATSTTEATDTRNCWHAEILPLADGQISLFLLKEYPEGGFEDYPIPAQRLLAKVAAPSVPVNVSTIPDETDSHQQLAFIADGGQKESARFNATLPQTMQRLQALTVNIPAIVIETRQYSLSFQVSLDKSAEK